MLKYILIAIVLFSCQVKKKGGDFSSEKLDTIRTAASAIPAQPDIFEKAFASGTKAPGHNAEVSLTGITVGILKIPSGRVVACDPMLTEEYGIPFTQNFPKGEFPVQLSIVSLEGVQAIGFARILFSNATVARWEFARIKSQQPLPVDGDKMHTYIVDASIGSFMDSISMREMEKQEQYGKAIYLELEKHQHYSWKYGLVKYGNHNIAAFSSGLGDGHYATYIGYDSTGQPARLLTDFDLVKWKKE